MPGEEHEHELLGLAHEVLDEPERDEAQQDDADDRAAARPRKRGASARMGRRAALSDAILALLRSFLRSASSGG